jgi:hypothetical protein
MGLASSDVMRKRRPIAIGPWYLSSPITGQYYLDPDPFLFVSIRG